MCAPRDRAADPGSRILSASGPVGAAARGGRRVRAGKGPGSRMEVIITDGTTAPGGCQESRREGTFHPI